MRTDAAAAHGDDTATSGKVGLLQHCDQGAQDAQEGKAGLVVH